VRNAFRSIADGSIYRLDAADDSDSTLYGEIGRAVPISRLAHLMIARSSNLATNLLIDALDPGRVHAAARELGADSIVVLRGVEDGPAYRRGLNNTTTARDLAVLLMAIAGGRAASVDQSRIMIEILVAQEFNDQIPAGLPAGVKVAHKTGEISGISHDAAIVFPPGRGPYALVILTEGFPDRQVAARLMADLSATVYRWATRRTDPRE
jgi:beta-lactamase class A